MAKWVTSERIHVDRVAAPWLIRRWIDPDAEFMFAPRDKVLEVARREGATPFGVPGADLFNQNETSTFQTILEKYGIKDPLLDQIGKISHSVIRLAVFHERDVLAPETLGVETIFGGQMYIAKDDHEALRQGSYIFDCLYAGFMRNRIQSEHKEELEKMKNAEERFAFVKSLIAEQNEQQRRRQ